MAESRCLLLYTKPARPGGVKTRLIGALTPAQAADLHAAFLADLVERLRSAPCTLRIAWAVGEGEPLPDGPVAGCRQMGSDLGARLYHGLAAAADEFPQVAAVGSDHPELPLERVADAFERLERGADVVLGPAADGGYYLVGTSRPGLRRELFEGIEWSTPRVLGATLDRCRHLGLAVSLLPQEADVDTPDDLARLAARLANGGAGRCPRTRELLAAWGRLAAAV